VIERLHVHTCLKDQTGVNTQKEICRKREIFTWKKQRKTTKYKQLR